MSDCSGATMAATATAAAATAVVMEHVQPTFCLLGATSPCPFPMLDRAWDVFSSKGIRTVVLSIGSSAAALPDLDIVESLGAPLHILPLSDAEKKEWQEVTAILKDRKRDAAKAISPFSAGTETKWVLPKNIRIQEALPWWQNGTLDMSGGETLQAVDATVAIKKICDGLRMKEETNRLDILKVDTVRSAPGLERGVLQALLSHGYRPGFVLVNWSRMPDEDVFTSMTAGHLQNCGYKLMKTEGSRFLYYFTDADLYQTCSWEDTKTSNPLMNELLKAGRDLALRGGGGPVAPPAEAKSSSSPAEGSLP